MVETIETSFIPHPPIISNLLHNRNPWEGVNILPFIDVKLLKHTIETHCPDSFLTADERHRNRIGEVFCYTHDAAVNDTVPSCNLDIGLPNIVKCNSRVYTITNHSTSTVSFKPELILGTKIPYPGFPSLNVLPIESVELRNAGINCFGFGKNKRDNPALAAVLL